MSEDQRVEFREKAKEAELDLPGWRVNKKVLYVVLGQLTCMIIVAYVVSKRCVSSPNHRSTFATLWAPKGLSNKVSLSDGRTHNLDC